MTLANQISFLYRSIRWLLITAVNGSADAHERPHKKQWSAGFRKLWTKSQRRISDQRLMSPWLSAVGIWKKGQANGRSNSIHQEKYVPADLLTKEHVMRTTSTYSSFSGDTVHLRLWVSREHKCAPGLNVKWQKMPARNRFVLNSRWICGNEWNAVCTQKPAIRGWIRHSSSGVERETGKHDGITAERKVAAIYIHTHIQTNTAGIVSDIHPESSTARWDHEIIRQKELTRTMFLNVTF